MNRYKEICGHCGHTFGSHLGNSYYSEYYGSFFPKDCCPGHEGEMDWEKGSGTTFLSTGIYKEEKEESEEVKERRIAESQPSLVEDENIEYVQIERKNKEEKNGN